MSRRVFDLKVGSVLTFMSTSDRPADKEPGTSSNNQQAISHLASDTRESAPLAAGTDTGTADNTATSTTTTAFCDVHSDTRTEISAVQAHKALMSVVADDAARRPKEIQMPLIDTQDISTHGHAVLDAGLQNVLLHSGDARDTHASTGVAGDVKRTVSQTHNQYADSKIPHVNQGDVHGVGVGVAVCETGDWPVSQLGSSTLDSDSETNEVVQLAQTDTESDEEPLLTDHAKHGFTYGVSYDKNLRRTMEDAHTLIAGFNGDRQGFFAVFDGHAGKACADYCAQEMHHVPLVDTGTAEDTE